MKENIEGKKHEREKQSSENMETQTDEALFEENLMKAKEESEQILQSLSSMSEESSDEKSKEVFDKSDSVQSVSKQGSDDDQKTEKKVQHVLPKHVEMTIARMSNLPPKSVSTGAEEDKKESQRIRSIDLLN